MRKIEKFPIYLVTAETRYLIASTFMRFQEHYESPTLRGKLFTLEEFMDDYAKQHGNFTYCKDWRGFNIPSWVLEPFHDGQFDPLLKKEKRLLDLLKDLNGRFYVIGLSDEVSDDPRFLKHEFVHGLFYTNYQYRRAVTSEITKHDTKKIRDGLIELGYVCHAGILDDEINAYTITGLGEYLPKAGKFTRKDVLELQKSLRAIFKQYFGFSICVVNADFIKERIHEKRV